MATRTDAENDMTGTLAEEEPVIIGADEFKEVTDMSDQATGGAANSQNGWVMVTTSDVKETQETQNAVEMTGTSSETEEVIVSGDNGEVVYERVSGDVNTGYTISKERQYVYIVCLRSDRRPGCKIGFVWGKGFCLNDKLIPLNNIRFVSKKHRLDRPPHFATSIVLSYIDSDSSPAEIKHLFLEMNTIKQTNDLFNDFIRLFEDKFSVSDDWDSSVTMATYSRACKQPVYYSLSNVTVTDKGGNVQCISCAVIIDIECMALYPRIGNGDLGKPYLLMFLDEEEEEEMRVVNIHHEYEAETIVFETKLCTFRMASSSELGSLISELSPKPRNILTDPGVLRRYVSHQLTMSDLYHVTLPPPVIRKKSRPKETVMTRFLREIDAAMKQCEDDVDFSADWLAVAAALTSVTTSGGEPESEPFTTVLPWMDASHPVHVRQILNDVIEELVKERYQNALSSVQAARRFVENQTDPEVKDIFRDPDTAVLKKLFYWNLVFGKPRRWLGLSATISNMSEWNRKKLMKEILGRLEDAVVRCEGNEDVQVYWVSLEADLNELVREDKVPYSDAFSEDYDANNPLHVEKALDEIAQRLKEEDYAVALAKLKAADRVFGKSETPEIARFFRRTDLDILKMLYCGSVVTEDSVFDPAWQEEGEVAQTNIGWPHRPIEPPTQGAAGAVSGLLMVEEQTRKQMRNVTGDLDDALARSVANEDLQMYWIVLEADLRDIIDRGTVPETDADSGGMNPEDPGHLKQALADVSDHLKNERLSIALSRLQATRLLFCQSKSSHIREFFDADDFTILKKLYFRALLE